MPPIPIWASIAGYRVTAFYTNMSAIVWVTSKSEGTQQLSFLLTCLYIKLNYFRLIKKTCINHFLLLHNCAEFVVLRVKFNYHVQIVLLTTAKCNISS